MSVTGEAVSTPASGAASDITDAAVHAASLGVPFVIPADIEALSADVTLPIGDNFEARISPYADLGGSFKLHFSIPYQGNSNHALHFLKRTYQAEGYDYGNIFQIASHAINEKPDSTVVALYGHGESKGGHVWGANIVASSTEGAAPVIALEVNPVSGAGSTGPVYAILVKAAGFRPQEYALGILANELSPFKAGIVFDTNDPGGFQPVTDYCIRGLGLAPKRFIRFTGKATIAEFEIPSLAVSATPQAISSRVEVSAGADAAGPLIAAVGTGEVPAPDANLRLRARGPNGRFDFQGGDPVRVMFDVRPAANANAYLSANASASGEALLLARGSAVDRSVCVRGAGQGSVKLQAGDGTTKVQASAAGIGFNGAPPTAKPTISGNRGGNAALASLLDNLAACGLIVNATSD